MVWFNNPNTVLNYDKDLPVGKDDPNNSWNIILDLMTTGDNYKCYTGNGAGGKKKIHTANNYLISFAKKASNKYVHQKTSNKRFQIPLKLFVKPKTFVIIPE